MNLKNKRVGIWGYGITGRSNANWALKHGARIGVMDTKELPLEQDFFSAHTIQFFTQDQLNDFFAIHDFVIPSAGIDLRPYYQQYKEKWLFELDIFAQEFKKPYIAITGSVGKTTITTLLEQLFKKYGKKVIAGGNIGNASLDLLAMQDEIELAVLEVSSFQLEHITAFAPTWALISNILENHLDRHGTMQNYITAKMNIIKYAQHAIIPENLREQLPHEYLQKTMCVQKNQFVDIVSSLPPVTFDQNWQIIVTLLMHMGLPLSDLASHAEHLQLPTHRMEYVGLINGKQVYNDSKATTPAATLAAVQRFANKPLHLLLGGLSKGVDREPLIAQLQSKVKKVYCFGKEATNLYSLCQKYRIDACSFETMEQAITACNETSLPDEIILLSPAGSSFDLFEDYQHRGNIFKSFIKNIGDK